jgi:hypothetical protein
MEPLFCHIKASLELPGEQVFLRADVYIFYFAKKHTEKLKKSTWQLAKCLIFLEPAMGVEPATY